MERSVGSKILCFDKRKNEPANLIGVKRSLLMDFCQYSEKYADDNYEYRHVKIPFSWVPKMPKGRLLSESEWRELGVKQSKGWVHYAIHRPEPHILLFRRPLQQQQQQIKDGGNTACTGDASL